MTLTAQQTLPLGVHAAQRLTHAFDRGQATYGCYDCLVNLCRMQAGSAQCRLQHQALQLPARHVAQNSV